MCDFSTLPAHILTNVLSHLSIIDFRNAVLTCKWWYYASCDPRIANNFCVRIPHVSGAIDFLSRPVYTLKLHHRNNLSKFRYRDLFFNFGHTISDLNLTVNISMPRLFELFIHLTNVKILTLYDRSKDTSTKNFYQCRRIAQHQEIICANMKNIRYLTVHVATQNLELYKLFLNNCTNIETFFWSWLCEPRGTNQSDFICNYLLNMNETRILENTVDLEILYVDHKIWESLVQVKLSKLRKLYLRGISVNLYDRMPTTFCQVYNNLEKFEMASCNDHNLDDICRYMKNLRSLKINNCSAQNSLRDIKQLQQLECLNLHRYDPVVDDGLIRLLNLQLNTLTSLSINKINALLLNAICNNCLNLHTLILIWIDTDDCEPIFKKLENLRKLHLRFTEFVRYHSRRRDTSVWNITKLTKLEDLWVSCFVSGITPEFIIQMPSVKSECKEILLFDYEYFDEDSDESVFGSTKDVRRNVFDLSEFDNFLSLIANDPSL